MSQRHVPADAGHRFWSICRLFYISLVEFREEHDSYDQKVMKYASETGIPRDVLRLRPKELAGLLNFKKFEELRDGYILELKELCHDVFRRHESTDPLDRYVSDIFHEISILKEEHYTLKTYATAYEAESEETELQYILDEAHSMFPYKMRQVLYLFGKAEERMEEHLKQNRLERIVVRSMYWHRDGFIERAYPDGVRAFYRLMYPCGPLEGFHTVARSFDASGFFPEALEAYELALAEAEPMREAAAVDETAMPAGAAPEEAGKAGGGIRWRPESADAVEELIASAEGRVADLKAVIRRREKL